MRTPWGRRRWHQLFFQVPVLGPLMKKQEWLLVPNLTRVPPDHVVRMAVGQDQIERAVVVIVEVLESPAAQKPGSLRNAVRVRDVVKRLVFVVSVKRKHFLIDIRHKEILPAIVVQIAGVDAHTGTRLAVVAKCYLGLQRNFFPAGLSGCVRTAVDEQKILVKIHPASRDRADALANLPFPGKVVSAKAGCGRSGNKTGSQPRVSPPRRRTEGGFFK